ncbi:MAG: hypothetical protein HZB19_03675, partial [Chloroflexi bacterium]|nr:hypothetical protein [Chloroflexota bacterium]
MPEANPIKGLGTLTPLQKDFMGILASLPDKDQFYLAGGTALAEYYLDFCSTLPAKYSNNQTKRGSSCTIRNDPDSGGATCYLWWNFLNWCN